MPEASDSLKNLGKVPHPVPNVINIYGVVDGDHTGDSARICYWYD